MQPHSSVVVRPQWMYYGRTSTFEAQFCLQSRVGTEQPTTLQPSPQPCNPPHPATLPRCYIAMLPSCHAAMLPCCHVATLPPCHASTLRRCDAATLRRCHAATLPRCHANTLARCHADTLSRHVGCHVLDACSRGESNPTPQRSAAGAPKPASPRQDLTPLLAPRQDLASLHLDESTNIGCGETQLCALRNSHL